MNNIVISGRVVRDFSLKETAGGFSVATMCVAVDKPKKEDGADFFDVTVWRSTAENCAKYLGKGSQVVISGRMESRKWQTKNGENRISWEIQGERVDFVGGKKEAATAGTAEYYDAFLGSTSSPGVAPPTDDDLPF